MTVAVVSAEASLPGEVAAAAVAVAGADAVAVAGEAGVGQAVVGRGGAVEGAHQACLEVKGHQACPAREEEAS